MARVFCACVEAGNAAGGFSPEPEPEPVARDESVGGGVGPLPAPGRPPHASPPAAPAEAPSENELVGLRSGAARYERMSNASDSLDAGGAAEVSELVAGPAGGAGKEAAALIAAGPVGPPADGMGEGACFERAAGAGVDVGIGVGVGEGTAARPLAPAKKECFVAAYANRSSNGSLLAPPAAVAAALSPPVAGDADDEGSDLFASAQIGTPNGSVAKAEAVSALAGAACAGALCAPEIGAGADAGGDDGGGGAAPLTGCAKKGSLAKTVEASGVRLVANGSTFGSAFAKGSDANGSTPPHASLLAAAAGALLLLERAAAAVTLLLVGEPHGSFAGSFAATKALHASTAGAGARAAGGLLELPVAVSAPVDAAAEAFAVAFACGGGSEAAAAE